MARKLFGRKRIERITGVAGEVLHGNRERSPRCVVPIGRGSKRDQATDCKGLANYLSHYGLRLRRRQRADTLARGVVPVAGRKPLGACVTMAVQVRRAAQVSPRGLLVRPALGLAMRTAHEQLA